MLIFFLGWHVLYSVVLILCKGEIISEICYASFFYIVVSNKCDCLHVYMYILSSPIYIQDMAGFMEWYMSCVHVCDMWHCWITMYKQCACLYKQYCMSVRNWPSSKHQTGQWWITYLFLLTNVYRITLIIATSDDSASDMHLNRLLEFAFNTMVGTKIFQ